MGQRWSVNTTVIPQLLQTHRWPQGVKAHSPGAAKQMQHRFFAAGLGGSGAECQRASCLRWRAGAQKDALLV